MDTPIDDPHHGIQQQPILDLSQPCNQQHLHLFSNADGDGPFEWKINHDDDCDAIRQGLDQELVRLW